VPKSSGVTAAALRPEAELLLHCSRTTVDSARAARIDRLLRAGVDWPEVMARARHHRVTSLVYRSLRRHAAPGAVPDEVLAALRDQFRKKCRRSLTFVAELRRVSAVLEAGGVRPVWFKGPEMAAAAYGRVVLRDFSDLDLLVRRRDAAAAEELLLAAGYRPYDAGADPLDTAQLDAVYSRTYRRTDPVVFVDLHWAVTWRSMHVPIDPEALWERRAPVRVGGSTVFTLSPEDMFLVLVVHGTKHQWEFLKLLCDVAELLRRRPNLDWAWIGAEARRLGCERMVALSLSLVADLLDAPVPELSRGTPWERRKVRALAAEVRAHLVDGPVAKLPPGPERLAFRLDVRERVRDRVRYSLHLARIGGDPDRWRVPVPALCSLAYSSTAPAWQTARRVLRSIAGLTLERRPFGGLDRSGEGPSAARPRAG
jgi:hypothetical protein